VPQALTCWLAVQVVQALSVALLCARVVLCVASHREPPQRGLVRLLLRELASFFFVFLAAALLVAALGVAVVRRRKKVANRDIRVWHGAAENGP
jgi:multisubunit Na+/H+ antiporter MnhG subunit